MEYVLWWYEERVVVGKCLILPSSYNTQFIKLNERKINSVRLRNIGGNENA